MYVECNNNSTRSTALGNSILVKRLSLRVPVVDDHKVSLLNNYTKP